MAEDLLGKYLKTSTEFLDIEADDAKLSIIFVGSYSGNCRMQQKIYNYFAESWL